MRCYNLLGYHNKPYMLYNVKLSLYSSVPVIIFKRQWRYSIFKMFSSPKQKLYSFKNSYLYNFLQTTISFILYVSKNLSGQNVSHNFSYIWLTLLSTTDSSTLITVIFFFLYVYMLYVIFIPLGF